MGFGVCVGVGKMVELGVRTAVGVGVNVGFGVRVVAEGVGEVGVDGVGVSVAVVGSIVGVDGAVVAAGDGARVVGDGSSATGLAVGDPLPADWQASIKAVVARASMTTVAIVGTEPILCMEFCGFMSRNGEIQDENVEISIPFANS